MGAIMDRESTVASRADRESRMKLGLFAINYGTCADPESAVEVARYAESAGFESVWTGEHVALPDPQPARRSMPPTLPFLDTTVALTLVATHTTTIKVASGIIVLPLHNPVVLAKALASVDVVSGGRLIVGVAAGYVEEEFAAVGVPLAGRHERVDDYIRAMRALWSMEHPRHRGPFASFEGIDAWPRPVQRPGPPLIVGGESRAALVRAVTTAHGWYGFSLDLVATKRFIAAFGRLAAEHERPADLGRLEITVTPHGELDQEVIERYEELGVDRLVLLPNPDVELGDRHRPVPLDRILHNIDRVAGLVARRPAHPTAGGHRPLPLGTRPDLDDGRP
jgi:probable F420-dependent oxidoreductase